VEGFRRLAMWMCVGALSLSPHTLWAAGELAPTASAAATNAVGSGPLPELPRLAPITLPEPDPSALQDLDRLLERLTSDDERTRTNAKAAIAESSSPSMIAAIRHRVQEIRASLDRDAAPRVLEDARKAGRKALKEKGEGAKKKGSEKGKSETKGTKDAKDAGKTAEKGKASPPKEATKGDKKAKEEGDAADGDWLDFVLDMPRPKDKTWRALVHLLAMERMLTAIGTTPAVRELIALHSYFGEMLRIDLQRQITKLKDKAVPALIEARQHDAKIVQRWANKQLDLLGRAIPGEAVATNDTQILADVLRAYGRTRDVDAVRVILSFCNSDRIQLREAARESIAAIGEPGIWQLRDVYLNITGSKPPREWTWDRIARELFATYDRARLVEVYALMDKGVALAGEGKLAEATEAFDKVLARSPLFDRRKEMVKTYVDRAMEIEGEKRDDALAMLRKALRLDPKAEGAKKIEAEIAYLEGVILIEQGSADRFLLTRALELDPGHQGARKALASLEEKAVERQDNSKRYAAAAGVGLAALIAMILLARRPRRPGGGSKRPDAPPGGGPPAGEDAKNRGAISSAGAEGAPGGAGEEGGSRAAEEAPG
jgi:tetratricopeptide (TPR) repeat protein